jgi:hypothetical protein
VFRPVFWIRDVLIQIRIRAPYNWIMEPDPDPDPALFFNAFQDANNNKFFSSTFLLIHTLGRTFTSVFKQVIKMYKTVEIKVLYFFLPVDGRTGSVQIIADPVREGQNVIRNNGSNRSMYSI